jgi:hypothetical protein
MMFIPIALRTCTRCHHRESPAGDERCADPVCVFEGGPCSTGACVYLGAEDSLGFAAAEYALLHTKVRTIFLTETGVILSP